MKLTKIQLLKRLATAWKGQEKRSAPAESAGGPDRPRRSGLTQPFLLTTETLQKYLTVARNQGGAPPRKYLFDHTSGQIVINGLDAVQHKEIAALFWPAKVEQTSGDLNGGKFEIGYEKGKFVFTISGHSDHFDAERPEFFETMHSLRKQVKYKALEIMRELDPNLEMITLASSVSKEVFTVRLAGF